MGQCSVPRTLLSHIQVMAVRDVDEVLADIALRNKILRDI